MEMRKEVRDAVNMVQRDLSLRRKDFQLLARQISVLTLNRSEIVENQNTGPFAPLPPAAFWREVLL